MNTTAGPTPASLLLIVRRGSEKVPCDPSIAQALAELGGVCLGDAPCIYRLRFDGLPEEALRRLSEACSREGGSAWVIAELPTQPDDKGPYRRMWDRSAEYAANISAWKLGMAGFPPLSAGEMIQL